MDTMEKEVKTMKTSEIVGVYNVLKSLKISKLKKEDQFAVIRAARALKPVATAFDDFIKDAQERLRPAGFDAVDEKRGRFEQLTAAEKEEVTAAVHSYNKDVNDCVQTEADREVEVGDFTRVSDDVIAGLVAGNEGLDIETVMILQDVIGG